MIRRQWGQGRWDKILMKRMTALSVADNFDEAKEEWIATGDVWWSGNGEVPEWVSSCSHPNYCLCGHGIVYHFRIRNTVNGNEDIVGSDHINSYLIMRQIAQEKSVNMETVTDEQVDLWLKERVGSMKAEAWWAENGKTFEFMFNRVKEIDVWYNAHVKGSVYNSKYRWNEPNRVLRKKGKGDDIASIVWRWNHPNNPKAQIKTRGYPNEKLMTDLAWFFGHCLMMEDEFKAWKQKRENRLEELKRIDEERARRRAEQEERARLAQIEWERGAPERERQAALEQQRRLEAQAQREARQMQRDAEAVDFPATEKFKDMCAFHGIPVFDSSMGSTAWEMKFLKDIRRRLESDNELSNAQMRSLKDIIETKPTEKQIKYLRDLGWEGEIPTKRFASNKIKEIKGD